MAHIDRELEARIQERPHDRERVIITLKKGAENQGTALGGIDTKRIMPEIYSGNLTGEQIMKLRDDDAIDDISPDIEFTKQ